MGLLDTIFLKGRSRTLHAPPLFQTHQKDAVTKGQQCKVRQATSSVASKASVNQYTPTYREQLSTMQRRKTCINKTESLPS